MGPHYLDAADRVQPRVYTTGKLLKMAGEKGGSSWGAVKHGKPLAGDGEIVKTIGEMLQLDG